MLNFMMSETGIWVTITIVFMIVVMSWFVYKMVKLSAPKE
jgi:F0F1-type ATP synthase membrane subunit b/b'